MPLGDVHFCDDFKPDFGIPWVPNPSNEVLMSWPKDKLAEYLVFREQRNQDALMNPVGAGWILPSWQTMMKNWNKYTNHVILGGNRCVQGDTLIYDPVLKVERRIDSIKGDHHVYAWGGSKRVVAKAQQPFRKDLGMMVEVRLSSGQRFVAALEHRVLSADGLWRSVSKLKRGDGVFHPQSILDTVLSDQLQDVQHLIQTGQGLKSGCLLSGHSNGEQPQSVSNNDQDVLPSQVCAPGCNSLFGSICHSISTVSSRLRERILGVLVDKDTHTRLHPRFCRHSILDVFHQTLVRCAGILSRAFYKPCESAWVLSDHPRFSVACQKSLAGSFLQRSKDGSVLLDTEFCYGLAYVTHIRLAGIAVKWDMTVATYGNYEAAGVVHHNSSKSMIASRLCVWAAGTIPGAEVRAYHVNEDRSIEDQQRMIWDALPNGIRTLPTKKGLNHSVQYSQKNGFTDNICILPPVNGFRRGGSIKFSNYRSYQADAQVAEGFKAHLIWCDEECPQKMFETLQYRTTDYHGRIILTFTTLTGWTPLVQDILGKTRTLEKRFAPLVGRELPVVQESLSRPGTIIYYFWTEDNSFIDTSDFRNKLLGRAKDEVFARAYGVPTKSMTSVFPGFNKEVNVIPHEKLPWTNNPDYNVTRYMVLDPAGSKNWFMLWVAIDAAGTWWVYREWPDYDDWALPGTGPEGKAGPAQKGSKKGINDYVELIKNCEEGETVFERFIDPRLGAAEKQAANGATTIISELDDAGMVFLPAPGVEIENGLQLINGLLSYDEHKPLSSLNAPKLYISERCQNLIYAMQEYTAKGGKEEATKDPIDCLRYLLVAQCSFVDPHANKNIDDRTWSY